MATLSGDKISYTLPQGRELFRDLSFTFSQKTIGLVGPNGVGKTTLFRLLMGTATASSGTLKVQGSISVLEQDLSRYNHHTVLETFGIAEQYGAYLRILAGEYRESDYLVLNDRWDIEDSIDQALAELGFSRDALYRPLESFSGGERLRILLAKTQFTKPDFYLLDEPSNNLDSGTRQKLFQWIRAWTKGMVIISHDRELLDLVDETWELSARGMSCYGGNYSLYREQKQAEEQKFQADLDNARKEERKARADRQKRIEAQERRQRNGKKNAGSMAKIMANAMAESAENTVARTRGLGDSKVQQALDKLEQLKDQRFSRFPLVVSMDQGASHHRKKLVEYRDLNLCFGDPQSDPWLWPEPLEGLILGGEKVRLTGANGSGKSSLVKLMTNVIAPTYGVVKNHSTNTSVLDQELSLLDLGASVLHNLQCFAGEDSEQSLLRTDLARLGFRGDQVYTIASDLSGGEKMRLALACVLASSDTRDLLILDEPTNNMDIETMELVASNLAEYKGAVLLISHDEFFVQDLGVDRELSLDF